MSIFFLCLSVIYVPGPNPLTYERNYTSSCIGPGGLCHGWNINNFGQVLFPDAKQYKTSVVQFWDDGGGSCFFQGNITKSRSEPIIHSISPYSIHQGVTNTSGIISGKTNIKNHRLEFNRKKEILLCKVGDGTLRNYSLRPIYGSLIFDITEEVLPNGNRIIYEYIFVDKYNDYRINKVKLLNKNNIELNSLEVSYIDKGRRAVKVKTSDERSVLYQFTNYKNKITKYGRDYLTKVVRSDGPEETYAYSKATKHIGEQLIRKNLPDGRYLINEYYPKNDKTKDDYGSGKVKLQKSPVGVDETPMITHRYEYFKHIDSSGYFAGGVTSVWDALNRKTNYHFSDDRRLDAIQKWIGPTNTELYRTEKFFWGGNHGANSTNLLSRCMASGNEDIQACHHYTYGNIMQWGMSPKKSMLLDIQPIENMTPTAISLKR